MPAFPFLLATAYLIGAGSSFVVPIVAATAGAPPAAIFALYFVGLLAGQWSVYRVAALTRGPAPLAVAQAALCASFVVMSLPGSWALPVGRLVEGVASGVSLPILFLAAVGEGDARRRERRAAATNALYALGYVSGPFLTTLLLPRVGVRAALLGLGATMAVVVLASRLAVRAPGPALGAAVVDAAAPAVAVPADAADAASDGWVDKFYLLFLAKLTSGFFVAYATAACRVGRLHGLPITGVLLVLSALFLVGQIAAPAVTARVPDAVLRRGLPAGLAVALAAYGVTGRPELALVGALVQSVMAFVGIRAAGVKASSARSLAFYNCLSDPGSLAGAALSGLGSPGLYVVAVAGLVPLVVLASPRRPASDAGPTAVSLEEP